MDSTSIAAWYGAALATAVLAWEIYKWVAYRVRIEVRARAGMKLITDAPSAEDATLTKSDDSSWVTITVSNQGELPTTLEQISMCYCRKLWQRMLHRPEATMIVMTVGHTLGGRRLPWRLEPGGTWSDIVKETSGISHMLEEGRLYCFAHCSTGKRPAVCRVKKSRVEPTTDKGDAKECPVPSSSSASSGVREFRGHNT